MVIHFLSHFFFNFFKYSKKKQRGALKLYLFCYPLMLHGE